MRIAIFGAGGRTGRSVVDEALSRGHEVTAFVRDAAEAAFPDDVTVVAGDARERGAVGAALAGVDAVLSAMGPVGDDPGTVYSEAVATVAAAMSTAGIRRLAVTANSRVLDDRPLKGAFAAVSEEHRRALATLRASDLDWTVVATPMLSDDEAAGTYRATLDDVPEGDRIPRPDFARALADALDHDGWAGHVVGVAG